ncbi:MAG: hypothetical protein HYV00_05380, partial [Deltaproteobacteria bacterium]|nr:hypothetical protein [Deltaproteobacteria bacterium]
MKSSQPACEYTMRIGILGSFNLDLLPRYIKPLLEERGLKPEFYLAGFNQYRQDILQGNSELYEFGPSHIVLLLEGEDLLRDLSREPFDFEDVARRERVSKELGEVHTLLEQIQGR